MEDINSKCLNDFKFFCFDGKAKMLFIVTDWQNKNRDTKFDEMIEIAEQLSKNIPHVRVDLYEINNKVYFGEYTFFHWSGFCSFSSSKMGL